MNKSDHPRLRRAILPVTTIAAAAVALAFPAIKALAQELKIAPRVLDPQVAKARIIQPAFVNPTAARLVKIAGEALSNQALAERIFSRPDAVADDYNLTSSERRVLRQMTRAQFDTAVADATQLVGTRLAQAPAVTLPANAVNQRLIAERMVVGRAILAAAGRNYLDAADAHACCPWSKAIELGTEAREVQYDQAISGRAMQLQAPVMQVTPQQQPR